jgi:N-acyl homoserine lactone hydrolase
MTVEKIYFFDAGSLYLDKSIFTAGRGFGTKEEATVHMALVKQGSTWILIDTGLNPLGVTEPEKAWGPRAKIVKPVIKEDNDVRVQLQQLGLSTSDIKYVINTHLHWDHTGGNRFFKESTFFVQKEEYRYAYWPHKFFQPSYMTDHFDCGVKYELVEGDMELFPGIFIFQTPGHTPGHQSVLVKLASGKHVLIAADAIYMKENLTDVIPPGNCWNAEAAISSIHKIRLVQSLTDAIVLAGHEPKLWSEIPRSPEFWV